MPQVSVSEHRRHPRSIVDCMVRLSSLGDSGDSTARCSHYCIVQDVSETGMKVWADRHYPADTQALLTFECEKVGIRHAISCVVMVVWADPEPVEDRWQLGIRFSDDLDSRAVADALSRGCLWCEKLCPAVSVP